MIRFFGNIGREFERRFALIPFSAYNTAEHFTRVDPPNLIIGSVSLELHHES